MTGIKLLVSEGMSTRNTTVAGLSIAIGMGVSLSNGCLNQMTSTIYDGLGMTMGLENFQSIINNTFASSPVVLATIFAVISERSKAGGKIKGNRSLRKDRFLGNDLSEISKI